LGDTSDIDRLIELGLNRYGAGDLDGALLMWEEALAIEPDNAQAKSYLDHVRNNYELLSEGSPSVEESLDAPFAIEEEPEYLIEIVPLQPEVPVSVSATLPPAAALMSLDRLDAGWDAEETHDTSAVFPGANADGDADSLAEPPPEELLELEAETPPVDFEDATREFHGVAKKISQPTEPTHGDFSSDEYTGGFNNPQGTPVNFSNIETEVRRRDLGFVKATPPARSEPEPEADLELGHHEATQERARYDTSAPATSDDDLIDSLPTPRPAASEQGSGESWLPGTAATRDMPASHRAPARLDSAAFSQAEVMLPHAPTRELSPNELRARALEPMLSAPTRELGLRPGGRPTTPLDDEDAPTGQSDVRAIRAAAAREDGRASRPGTEGTKHDIVLQFDPIVAQAAEILDDVDAGAPAGESHEETTRRRITRLLELAADWNDAGELDKAVSAVDLALSEDPNSALGQKLITRNKDTIMSLFQQYLGNLDRMPHLAKPLQELANASISPRAAFLLSRIDGTLTIDELLDVSGMPRLEAYRHLCQLFLRGILR